MAPIAEWLPAFLNSRGLEKADGRPLYAYRCTDPEFDALTEALRAELPARPRYGKWSYRQMQAFCLWAAEWWRRNHEGGSWAWEAPLHAIGCSELGPGCRGYRELCEMVDTGIRWWGRELLRTGHGRAFLVTLACEGGLPLKLVLREQAGLRRYFRALLEEFRVSAPLGVAPEQMAERVRAWLPRSLRHDVVYQLSGELIGKIWELQAEVGETRTPVKALDRQRPGWREDLPLQLDDAVARSLLNNLVSEASVLARQRGRRIRWRRMLQPVGDGWQLVGELGLPASLEAQDLRPLFGFGEEEPLPPRFELARVPGEEAPEVAALGTRRFEEGGAEYFALEPTSRQSRRVIGVEAADANELLLRDGRRTWTTTDFGGAEGLSEDLPWVFEPRGEEPEVELRLVGEGSVSLRGPEALVAVPPGAELEVEPGDESGEGPEALGRLEALDRAVYRVRGELAVVEEAGRSTIRTGVEGALGPAEYRLSGPRKGFGRGTSAVFVGSPRIVEERASGSYRTIPAEQVSWRPSGAGGAWRPYDERCVGDVRIRHAVDGELRFSTAAKVIPRSATIAFRPEPQRGAGSRGSGAVELQGFGPCVVRVEPRPGVSTTIEAPEGADPQRVTLGAVGDPPRTTTVWLEWDEGRRLALELPFPAQDVSFHRPDGSRLESGERVSVRNLSGIHGRALVPRTGCSFFLDGQYRGTGVSSELHHALTIREPVPEIGDGHYEYDLGNLQSRAELLLSMTDDVDGVLRVELQSNEVTGLPRRTLHLGHYDLEFERGEGEVTLAAGSFARVDPDTMAGLRVEAFRPAAPQEPARELPRVRNGVWAVPEAEMEPGPWLIVGWDGGWCRMRPALWIVGGEPEPEEPQSDWSSSTLEDALAVREEPPATGVRSAEEASSLPSRTRRVAAFKALLEEMAGNPDHPDWQVLDGTVRWARDLPATTFDLIDALIQVPEAAAMAALRSPDDDDFSVLWDRLETLPFSWRAVPVGAWEHAVEHYAKQFEAQLATVAETVPSLDVHEEVAKELDRIGARVVSRLQSVAPVFQCMRAYAFGEPLGPEGLALRSGKLDETLLAQLAEAERNLLRARADHDQWPGGAQLEAQARTRKREPACAALWREAGSWLGYRQDVLDAPILAAILAVENVAPPRALMQDFRRIAEFDRQWFEDAQRSAFLYAYGRYLAKVMEGESESADG